ncbi:hypothetical protein E2C01_055491 [Portunus trituberculatus]|uniref:Uncharacterized protein n=1 Tax=Portunus trituberculatus TaxID=210409 RepID=A0A5B7GV55_PORTR|nr:hypothetical protein [Portunus trituberculatus]
MNTDLNGSVTAAGASLSSQQRHARHGEHRGTEPLMHQDSLLHLVLHRCAVFKSSIKSEGCDRAGGRRVGGGRLRGTIGKPSMF